MAVNLINSLIVTVQTAQIKEIAIRCPLPHNDQYGHAIPFHRLMKYIADVYSDNSNEIHIKPINFSNLDEIARSCSLPHKYTNFGTTMTPIKLKRYISNANIQKWNSNCKDISKIKNKKVSLIISQLLQGYNRETYMKIPKDICAILCHYCEVVDFVYEWFYPVTPDSSDFWSDE